ncbi:MAG: TonB-dependent receptor [Cryomorphaceae bacterium]|nr:TonB-dependent receptor [Cryomorphaceae bacterium]
MAFKSSYQMHRRALFFLIFIGAFYRVSSQDIQVMDAETKAPLELVTIFNKSTKAVAFTDFYGKASAEPFVDAELINFRIIGYKAQTMSYQKLKSQDFVVYMRKSNLSLTQIDVSAIRWRQASNNLPAKQSALSAKEIAFQNPQTAADVLGASGEVFIQKSQQGGGSPMIRGFSANRLLLSVDGVRMNTAIFRSGNVQNVISLDPFTISQTEILFGPGSVVFGSDALGGVMQFITKKPQTNHSDKTEVNGNYAGRYATANNEVTNHIDVNIGGKNWAALTSITFTEFGDLRMGSRGPEENYLRTFKVERIDDQDIMTAPSDPLRQSPTGYQQLNFMQKVFYSTKNWDFNYAFHYSGTSEYDRYDRLIQKSDGLPRSAEWRYGPQIWTMNYLEARNYYSNRFYDVVSLRFAHQFFEESRIDRGFNRNTRRTRIEKVNAISGNVDFYKSLGRGNKINYGVEWVLNDVQSEGFGENIMSGERSAVLTRYPQSTWNSMAIFGVYERRLTRELILQTGVRYNHFDINSDFSQNAAFFPLDFQEANINTGAISGSAGLVYNPRRKLFIRANLSSGFRAPNVDDIGKVFDSEPDAVVVPNPNLRPEYAYNAEWGIAAIVGNNFKFDLSIFATYLDNAMVRRDFSLGGSDSILYDGEPARVQAIQNASYAIIYGAQTYMEYRFDKFWSINNTFNFQRGNEETDDGQLSATRHAAPWFGIARLEYQKAKFTFQFYSAYSGTVSHSRMPIEEVGKAFMYAVDENGNPYSPGWMTLNLKGMYKMKNGVSVMMGFENITNQRYRPFASGLVAPGRNFIISIRASI